MGHAPAPRVSAARPAKPLMTFATHVLRATLGHLATNNAPEALQTLATASAPVVLEPTETARAFAELVAADPRVCSFAQVASRIPAPAMELVTARPLRAIVTQGTRHRRATSVAPQPARASAPRAVAAIQVHPEAESAFAT